MWRLIRFDWPGDQGEGRVNNNVQISGFSNRLNVGSIYVLRLEGTGKRPGLWRKYLSQ